MPVRICTSSERQRHGDWRKLEVLKPNIAPLHTILQHFAHLEIVGPSLRVYSLPRFQYRERSSDGNTGFSGFLCHSRQTQNEPHIPDRAKIIKKWGCSYPKLVQKHQSKLSFKLSTTGQSPIWLLSKTLVSCGLQLQIETGSSERLWTYLLFKEIYIIYIYTLNINKSWPISMGMDGFHDFSSKGWGINWRGEMENFGRIQVNFHLWTSRCMLVGLSFVEK